MVGVRIGQVTAAESLFFYEVGQNVSTVSNPEHVPVFADEITFTNDQLTLCEDDRACLFDLVQTGDMDVASQTLQSSNDLTQLASTIGKEKFTVHSGF